MLFSSFLFAELDARDQVKDQAFLPGRLRTGYPFKSCGLRPEILPPHTPTNRTPGSFLPAPLRLRDSMESLKSAYKG